MKKMYAVILLCIAAVFAPSHGFKTGAGAGACDSMMPGHDSHLSATTPAPYEVILSKSTYSPGEILQVTVRQKAAFSDTFKGFLLQARRADPSLDQNVRLGNFTAITDTVIRCADALSNAITHASDIGKTSVTVSWTAPASYVGHIEFRATFVKVFDTLWVAEKSSVITDPTAPAITTGAPAKSDKKLFVDSKKLSNKDRSDINDIIGNKEDPPLLRVIRQVPTAAPIPGLDDLSPCGTDKGCYRNPPGCEHNQCETLVTWQDMTDYIHFEMSAATIGWVAVGFSDDTYMGHDSVIECVFVESNAKMLIQHTYNSETGKANEYVGTRGISNMDGSANDDHGTKRLNCRFDRAKTSSDSHIFDLSSPNEYHMLVTMGDATKTGGKIKHSMEKGKEPKVSPYKIDLTRHIEVTGEARYSLVKAHGCLMVIAWVMSAGLAIIMARYYKPMWPNNRMCGERVWFAVHRFCMILTLFCTVVGFIIIFIQAGGYSKMSGLPNSAHPILGIIVTILVVVNPLLALCRCHPKHKYRPVFNWIHWFIGTIAFVLQSPTVFIGLGLPKASVPSWLTWVMVAFLLFHVVVELMLEIHGCINSKKQKERNQEWEMRKKNDPTHETSEQEPEPVGTRFKTIMIALYLIVMLILGSVIVITIAVY